MAMGMCLLSARAASIADKLGVDLAIVHKERKVANQVSRMILVGNVADKVAILVDDIADACGTLALASSILREQGAKQSTVIVAHGFLSGPIADVVENSHLDALVVANTLPFKIKQFDVSATIAEAIRRTHNGES
ncbi:phosphoribosyltransferase-like protein [Hypoxylon cercidicola]|nr:phosphoribosyltransferase-like protein [Hypoxylon cercidicola]